MDFGELKTRVANYLHRDDLTDTIPDFIEQAQARINHDIDTMSMDKAVSLTVTASIKEVTMPTDILELKSVRIPFAGGVRTLVQRSLVQNSQVLETTDGATAAPLFYARYGDILELTPIPESATTLEIIYKARLASFVDDTDTDFLLTNYPNIYVYASMLEAMPFLIADQRVGIWRDFYKEEVTRINEIAFKEEWSGAPIRISNLGVNTP